MDEVAVQFLGSGDALGSGGRLQACIHVRSGNASFLIDCGASSLIGMKKFGVAPGSIEWVLLSHLHGDHFGGIPFLLLDGQFSGRTQPLAIAGPEGVESRVKAAMEVLFPGSSKVERKFSVSFAEFLPRKERVLGPFSVTAYEGIHPSGPPAFSLRVQAGGKVIAYSGDTEWTDALPEVARDADLFICEAYYFEKKVKFHLDYKTILDRIPRLGCKKIILTHLGRDMLTRLGEVKIDWAEDGKKVLL
ncbi:MAG: MBL fold metallo-hydrolase [Syntrophaceae bacterium]|nr:MBL fold metallo-hydrolase [Syntrophaceae bacterium]